MLVDDNYLEEALAKRTLSLSKLVLGRQTALGRPSVRRRCKAELPCPNAPESCPCGDLEWTCDECNSVLQYADNLFICDCGSGTLEAFKFRYALIWVPVLSVSTIFVYYL